MLRVLHKTKERVRVGPWPRHKFAGVAAGEALEIGGQNKLCRNSLGTPTDLDLNLLCLKSIYTSGKIISSK